MDPDGGPPTAGQDRDADDAGDMARQTMRERTDEGQAKLYVLLEADRWVLTATILAGIFVALLLVGVFAPVPLREIAGDADPIGTLFQALVTAIITGVTVVVTITQLVISQELGPLGDQDERMEGAMSYRRDVEDRLATPVTPLEPAAFLAALVDSAGSRGAAFRETIADVPGPAGSRAASFADSVTINARLVEQRLDDAQFGTYDVLSAALDFNYATKIYDARRLRAQHGDELPAGATEALDDVVDSLTAFAPAREHIKTLYFQWELTNLLREILYLTVPALLVAMVGVLFLDTPATISGATFGVDNLLLVVCAAITVAVAPFALLLSYVLRVATIAKHTLAIEPLALRSVDRSGGIDWESSE